jgi:hypothetical protein
LICNRISPPPWYVTRYRHLPAGNSWPNTSRVRRLRVDSHSVNAFSIVINSHLRQ